MKMPFDFYAHYTVVKKRPDEFQPADRDDSLLPATVVINPADPMYGDDQQLQRTTNFSIVRTNKGRIFTSYFSGGGHADEDTGNWDMIIASDDDAFHFRNAVAVNPPNPETTRVFEGLLWLDPSGRLWYFYVQSYRRMDGREGVWCIRCDDPDADVLRFTAPRRICDGIIPSVPIVLKDGRWAMVTYLHDPAAFHGDMHDDFNTTDIFWFPQKVGISFHVSADEGESFQTLAEGIRFPYATFYECCPVEKQDGSLWILIRGMNCTGQTFSYDGGYTWTPATVNGALPLPNTHFYINRLKSGRLLLLANYKANMFSYFVGRNNLTALISDDDGKSWRSSLLLDEREGVEQPAFFEADNGFIYISYGRAPQFAAETLLSIVTEEDILAGKIVNEKSRLKISAGRGTGMQCHPWYPELLKIAQANHIEM